MVMVMEVEDRNNRGKPGLSWFDVVKKACKV